MSLVACQRVGGSFLKQLEAVKVLSCVPTPAAAPAAAKGKAGKKDAAAVGASGPAAPTFDVKLSDSVLFPEGGGQPTDYGTLTLSGGEKVRVLAVSRTPDGVIHRVEKEVPVEKEVTVDVDWPRRFDHMQQHSAQHLISAVAKRTFGFKTLAWWLASAPQESHIELDAPAGISPEQLAQLESEINEIIRRGSAMNLHTWDSLAAAREDDFFKNNVSKALPDSHDGAIRVVEIDSLEFNPCCGTHLTCTAQLQAVKLTRVAKEKTCSKLFFLAGDRVLQTLHSALDTQRTLTNSLSCPPDMHADAVRRLQGELKGANKQLATLLKEMAETDAQRLLAAVQKDGGKVAQLHRDEVGLNYLAQVVDIVNDTIKAQSTPASPFLLLLSSSDAVGGKEGAFILTGDEALVTARSSELATRLSGKGGGRKGKFQGKAAALDAKTRAEAFEWLQNAA